MTDRELEKKILKTKEKINSLLEKRNADAYEQVYELCMADEFQVQRDADNDLIIVMICSMAWKQEQAYQKETVYDFICVTDKKNPIQQLRELYTNIKLYLFRIENNLPQEKTEEGIRYIIDQKVSGDLLHEIAGGNLENPMQVLLLLGTVMMSAHEYTRAARIYALLRRDDQKNEQVIIAQARMYMEIGNYAEAYQCLVKIPEPDAEMKKLMKMLKAYVETGKEQE